MRVRLLHQRSEGLRPIDVLVHASEVAREIDSKPMPSIVQRWRWRARACGQRMMLYSFILRWSEIRELPSILAARETLS